VNISIVISIKDVNDNAPIFDQPSYAINIAEELPIGTIVLIDLEANDADQDGPNSHIRYDIVDDEHKVIGLTIISAHNSATLAIFTSACNTRSISWHCSYQQSYRL
jgi:hypothetical protein